MRKQTPCAYHKTGIVLYHGRMYGLMYLSHCLRRTDYESGACCDKPPKKEKFTQKQFFFLNVVTFRPSNMLLPQNRFEEI